MYKCILFSFCEIYENVFLVLDDVLIRNFFDRLKFKLIIWEYGKWLLIFGVVFWNKMVILL